MIDRNNKEEMVRMIEVVRKEILDGLNRHAAIGPTDWHVIDAIMSAVLKEISDCTVRQTLGLLQLIVDNDLDVTLRYKVEIIRLNVHIALLTSVLMAHFDVIQETGRTAHDAHLHLDRVRRCAEDQSDISMAEVQPSRGG